MEHKEASDAKHNQVKQLVQPFRPVLGLGTQRASRPLIDSLCEQHYVVAFVLVLGIKVMTSDSVTLFSIERALQINLSADIMVTNMTQSI